MTIRKRWAWTLLALLVLSLSLNLFAGGLLVGRHLAGPRMAGGQHGPLFAGGLPREAREAVRDVFAAHRDELGQRMAAVHESRRSVLLLLRAPQLDEAALDSAFAGMRDRSVEAQAVMHEIMKEAALVLPAEARAGWRPRLLGRGAPD